MKRALALTSLAVVVLLAFGESWAQGSLNVYCSVQAEWCQAIATVFSEQTGIKVTMTQKGSGEALAQIIAEAANPKGDVWFGGTGDPHLQAAEQDLTLATSRRASQAARLGAAAGRAVGLPDGRHLLGRARLRLQHRAARRRRSCRAAGLLDRSAEAGLQGRDPDREPGLLGHRLHGASPRSCS